MEWDAVYKTYHSSSFLLFGYSFVISYPLLPQSLTVRRCMSVHHPRCFSARDVGRYVQRFHELSLLEPPQAIRSGYDTAVWRLPTRSGDYIAKIFVAERLEAVRAEAGLLDYLRNRGIHTPELIENRRGQRVGTIAARSLRAFFRPSKSPIIVMPLENTRSACPQSITPDELSRIGQCIGLMHKVLQAYPGRASIRRFEYWDVRLGRFGDFLESPNARSYDAAQLAKWSELDQRMEQLAGVVRRSQLTESVIHGDLGLDHVRLRNTQACSPAGVSLFDFSDSSFGPVVSDLATMLSRLYWEGDISLDRWRQLRAWLLHGYESGFALTENDRGALDYALMERLLIEVRYLNRVSLKTQAPHGADGIKKRYELAAHLLERGLHGACA